MSTRLRRCATLAATATALLVLTGCGTGLSAQTNQPYDAAAGSNHRSGRVDVLNALFVDNGDGTATFSGTLINKDTSAHTLNAASVTAENGAPITSTLSGPQDLAPQIPYTPGQSADLQLTGAFPDGGFVKVAFDFDGVAPVTLQVPIVTRTDIYKDVAEKPVAPAATPEPTPTATPTP